MATAFKDIDWIDYWETRLDQIAALRSKLCRQYEIGDLPWDDHHLLDYALQRYQETVEANLNRELRRLGESR